MATTPISAVDAVAPAFARMKQILFQRFRPGMWLRLLVIGFLAGEFSSGGGGIQAAAQFPMMLGRLGAIRGIGQREFLPLGSWPSRPHLLPILVAVAVAVAGLSLLFIYLQAVMRFILLEAVVNGRVRLRQSFGHWHARAVSLFLWRLVFVVVVGTVALLLVAGPLLLAWRSGFLPAALRAMLPMIVVATLLLFVVGIAATVIWLLVKDFAVPLMALQGLSAIEACDRLFMMLRADPGGYAGYVGMKIVLALAVSLIAGIAFFVVILVLGVPAVLLVVAGFMGGGSTAGHALAITIVIVLGAIAVLLLLIAGMVIAVGALVFFQAYVLQFFAGRYDPLAALLFPAAPPTAGESQL